MDNVCAEPTVYVEKDPLGAVNACFARGNMHMNTCTYANTTLGFKAICPCSFCQNIWSEPASAISLNPSTAKAICDSAAANGQLVDLAEGKVPPTKFRSLVPEGVHVDPKLRHMMYAYAKVHYGNESENPAVCPCTWLILYH
jgi:hypothetical protein